MHMQLGNPASNTAEFPVMKIIMKNPYIVSKRRVDFLKMRLALRSAIPPALIETQE